MMSNHEVPLPILIHLVCELKILRKHTLITEEEQKNGVFIIDPK